MQTRTAGDNTNWRRWVETALPLAARKAPARSVLLVSYFFPPAAGSAVQRPAKLAQYLTRFNWSVDVLTAGHDHLGSQDSSLVGMLEDSCNVYRVAGWEPACIARAVSQLPLITRIRGVEDALHWRLTKLSHSLGIEEPESLWTRSAVAAASRLHRNKAYDAVISTGPPQFVHRVASQLAGKLGIPWVADVRDPFVSDFERTNKSRYRIDRMQALEGEVLTRADAVVTTCQELAQDFQTRYAIRDSMATLAITNGFDRSDLQCALADVTSSKGDDGTCLFCAIGSFYGRREIRRIIEPLADVLARHPDWRSRVQLVFAGSIDTQQRQYWQQHAPDWVTFKGYVSHDEAVRLATRSCCNIVIVPECRHGRQSIPGKTFELLALPTHLLAMVPPGSETEAIVRQAGASTLAPFEDHRKSASAMAGIISDHFQGCLQHSRDWPSLNRYDRQVIASCFDSVLRHVIDHEAIQQQASDDEVGSLHDDQFISASNTSAPAIAASTAHDEEAEPEMVTAVGEDQA
jgi:hypothetical protein